MFRDPETIKASVDVARFAIHYQEQLNEAEIQPEKNSVKY
jgi:hypothetical protein